MSVTPERARKQSRPSPTLALLVRFGPMLAWLIPLALIEVVLRLALSLSYKLLIDRAIIPHDESALIHIMAFLGCGILAASLVAVARDALYARASCEMLAALRQRIFDQYQRLSVAYHVVHPPSEILSRLASDTGRLETAIVSGMSGFVLPALAVILGIAFAACLLEWRLVLLGLVLWPLATVLSWLLSPHASLAAQEKQHREAAVLASLEEALATQRVIRAFGLEAFSRARFRRRLDQFKPGAFRASLLGILVERATVLSIYAAQAITITVAAVMAFHGEISVGTMVAFCAMFWSIGWSIIGLAQFAPTLIGAHGALRSLDDLFSAHTDEPAAGQREATPVLAQAIQMVGVCFAYPGRQPLLNDLSLQIPHGEFVAIVGRSGSGKTTVLQLLVRFLEPGGGQILWDGQDVRVLEQVSLRARIGIVLQETQLFDASIGENIGLGREGASHDEIVAAARAAEIHETIMALPMAYDTPVGERGSQLSGGQRQRIALARALIRKPSLLLLDEPTSALDPMAEAGVLDTLFRERERQTTVLVTHRLLGLARATRIIVMDGGVVIEEGSHEALLARGGMYRTMWDKQSGFEFDARNQSVTVKPGRLASIPLLKPLSAAALERLAGEFVSESAEEGQDIIQEGDAGERFYLLVRGTVAIRKSMPDGTIREVSRLSDGDQFGEIALLKDTPRTATVTALTPCLLMSLSRDQFLTLLDAEPGVRDAVERVVKARG